MGDNAKIKACIEIKIDSKDNLWLLDMIEAAFTIWNIKEESLVEVLEISKEVVLPNSFLQDFFIDEKRNRIVIADMTLQDSLNPIAPAFIVIDKTTGEAKRMAQPHESFMPDFEGGSALNPIVFEPESDWIYFGAMHSKKLYRAPAANFDNEEKLIHSIESFGEKSYCDGIAVDKNQNVYITNVEDQAIGVTNKNGFKNIAMLPEGQVWPDGLCIFNGNVFCSVNQLSNTPFYNNGKDLSKPPFLLISTELLP